MNRQLTDRQTVTVAAAALLGLWQPWLMLTVAALWLAWRGFAAYAGWCRTQRERREALAARCVAQHYEFLLGDPHGTYGRFA